MIENTYFLEPYLHEMLNFLVESMGCREVKEKIMSKLSKI